MIGNNSMSMCKAMMIEMVQHFFDTKLLKEGVVVKVTNVKEIGGFCPTFEVSFEPVKPEGCPEGASTLKVS